MGEFLRTWYGLTLFIVFDAAAAIAVLAIGWRWVFKRIFDFLVSVVCMAVLSPAFLAVFVRGKLLQRRTGEPRTLISREYCVGKKAKAIALHVFRTDSEAEEAEKYNAWLKRTGLYKLPYLFDVFCGRLSFVGVKRLSLADAALVSEADEGRFSARPGFINPLAVRGDEDTDYPEMFRSDLFYARKTGLFLDLKIFFFWAVRNIRGERGWMGETSEKSYAEALLEAGEIDRTDFDAVAENARAEEEELREKYEPEEPEGAEEPEAPKETEEAEGAEESGRDDGAEARDEDEKGSA